GVASRAGGGGGRRALVGLAAGVWVRRGRLSAPIFFLTGGRRASSPARGGRPRLYRLVEWIGRWSMLDVFVDTFTVALVQLQPLMSVEPGAGVLFFAAVVVLTMIAAETFDPRLILDASVRPPEGQHA